MLCNNRCCCWWWLSALSMLLPVLTAYRSQQPPAPSGYKHHYYQHRQRATPPPPSPSSSPKVWTHSDGSPPVKVQGYLNCMIEVHEGIKRCNDTYHHSLYNVIKQGYKKDSKQYRRQFCCGSWHRERCIIDHMERVCARQTVLDLKRDKNSYVVDLDKNKVKCDGFERSSPYCSAAIRYEPSLLLATSLLASILSWKTTP